MVLLGIGKPHMLPLPLEVAPQEIRLTHCSYQTALSTANTATSTGPENKRAIFIEQC